MLMNTVGGTISTSTPLPMAFCPSFEAAAAVLKHIAQPWLNAGAAHAETIKTSMAVRSFISLPAQEYAWRPGKRRWRSEEHTSELQSRLHLVCRLLLEKKKKNKSTA